MVQRRVKEGCYLSLQTVCSQLCERGKPVPCDYDECKMTVGRVMWIFMMAKFVCN